jgi:hypothetical protein
MFIFFIFVRIDDVTVLIDKQSEVRHPSGFFAAQMIEIAAIRIERDRVGQRHHLFQLFPVHDLSSDDRKPRARNFFRRRVAQRVDFPV